MNNKLKHIKEANKRLDSRAILEQTTESLKYSVQQDPTT